MPRYFVDLSNGASTFTDRDGQDADSLEAARMEAVDLLADLARSGAAAASEQVWVATIRNRNGTALCRVTLALMSVAL